MREKTLVLFDIDGTLVRRGYGHHREAFIEAIDNVYRVSCRESFESLPLQGNTDNQIALRTLKLCGIGASAGKRKLGDLKREMERIFLKRVEGKRITLFAGTEGVLRKLKSSGVKIGLLTGNYPRIALGKMAAAGVDGYFSKRLSGFGDQGYTRKEMAKITARKLRGWRTIVVGDTRNDVVAGKAMGAVTVAVLTGGVSRRELAKEKPDFIIKTLRELPKIVGSL